jgi:3-phenylpropionate/cinnamic acid dioxygenase small subunit
MLRSARNDSKGCHCEARSDEAISVKFVPAGGDPVNTKREHEAAAHPLELTAQQALWVELMQFYIREAWLLDERKLTEWLDLFTDDVLYFMPRRKNVLRREAHREMTPLGDLAILEEDKRYLEMRVARLDTGMAWAEDPPSRTRHLIGNLEAAPLENGEVEARTAFLVYRSHLETDHQLLSGCREDVLRKVEGAWKVARRTIVLDANVLLDKNLSVFL